MKRIAVLIIALLLVMGFSIPAAAMETNASEWAASSMEQAFENGFIEEAALQKAKDSITRIEFCEIVLKLYESVAGNTLEAKEASPFTDCDDPAVIAAYEAGIISGTTATTFAPNDSLTREQLAIMLNRILRVCGKELPAAEGNAPFGDISNLYQTSIDAINRVYSAKILSGDSSGFYPFRALTYQEAIVGFMNTYKYYIGDNGNAGNEPEVADNTETPAAEAISDAETVYINDKSVSLGMSPDELTAAWGEPDRIDKTVYGLDRYVYIGDYTNYFFVTFKSSEIIEIFVPTKNFSYMGTDGDGNAADIVGFDYVSNVEHSAIIDSDTTEARVNLDYAGTISGLLLQEKSFARSDSLISGMNKDLRDDVSQELLDLIQVKRVEKDMPMVNVESRLAEVALSHSTDMSENTYTDYAGSDGSTPFSRIMNRGITFSTASEIVVCQRGDVVNVYQQWIRTNAQINSILDPSMDSVGIGVVQRIKDLYITVDFCGNITD